MSVFLYRLAHWSVHRRRLVLAAWLAALVGTVALAMAADGETSDTFEMPGTESQQAVDLLDERFPSESGSTARVVFATGDVDSETARSFLERSGRPYIEKPFALEDVAELLCTEVRR